jgi:hypothetical protein
MAPGIQSKRGSIQTKPRGLGTEPETIRKLNSIKNRPNKCQVGAAIHFLYQIHMQSGGSSSPKKTT